MWGLVPAHTLSLSEATFFLVAGAGLAGGHLGISVSGLKECIGIIIGILLLLVLVWYMVNWYMVNV